MRNSANLSMRGAALVKRQGRWKQPKKRCSRLKSIALLAKSPLSRREPDAAKAEAYFERALAVARAAAGKILGTARGDEHGAALARSGKVQQARELLAPVYGWFTEGFDTLDLKEAKVLLDELRA